MTQQQMQKSGLRPRSSQRVYFLNGTSGVTPLKLEFFYQDFGRFARPFSREVEGPSVCRNLLRVKSRFIVSGILRYKYLSKSCTDVSRILRMCQAREVLLSSALPACWGF